MELASQYTSSIFYYKTETCAGDSYGKMRENGDEINLLSPSRHATLKRRRVSIGHDQFVFYRPGTDFG